MKRLVSIVSSLLVAFAILLNVPDDSQAATRDSKKILVQNNEITDLNVLFENALKGESDLKLDTNKITHLYPDISSSDKSSYKNLANISKDDILKVENYNTAQLLKKSIDESGKTTESYAITSFQIVSDHNETDPTLGTFADSSKGDSKWDGTLGVKAYSTIYIDYFYNSRDDKYWDLTKATGGWTVQVSDYVLFSRTVTIGQTGAGIKGGLVKEKKELLPSTNTWSYTPSSSWADPVVAYAGSNAAGSVVGAYSHAMIKRNNNSYSWAINLSNNMK
ncbi:hypothetical protein B4102_2171 [Heyndrickxia sporothermodurans]|uniref:Uncharacterized protein n=1 Tax=Heyndrickxia sporothermodurans TaxID=46224 RepID=A0A150LGD7_9BACI|nr:hypothetical protein [Heyndrickxia sporothermodurans]KYD11443.1 hypothetical protein B4102_2171 [Heyndrickxia sporothermodurans]